MTALLSPRTVFVTEALVEELDPTPDELALCIGHELGHLICGHTEDRIYLKAMLAYAELILLAFLDPTGLLTLLGAMGFQNTAGCCSRRTRGATRSRPTRRA